MLQHIINFAAGEIGGELFGHARDPLAGARSQGERLPPFPSCARSAGSARSNGTGRAQFTPCCQRRNQFRRPPAGEPRLRHRRARGGGLRRARGAPPAGARRHRAGGSRSDGVLMGIGCAAKGHYSVWADTYGGIGQPGDLDKGIALGSRGSARSRRGSPRAGWKGLSRSMVLRGGLAIQATISLINNDALSCLATDVTQWWYSGSTHVEPSCRTGSRAYRSSGGGSTRSNTRSAFSCGRTLLWYSSSSR